MNRFLSLGALIVLTVFIFGAAYASSVNNDGRQKKQSAQSSTILGAKFKTYFPLSFSSGYRLKGSLQFTTTDHQSMVMHHNVMRFEKGNTLYVLPYRQKQAHARIKIGVHP